MCVCVCMCIYIYIHTYTCIHMCITTYIYIYIYIYISQVAGLRGGLRADGVAGPVGRPHLAEAVLGGRYIYIYIYIHMCIYVVCRLIPASTVRHVRLTPSYALLSHPMLSCTVLSCDMIYCPILQTCTVLCHPILLPAAPYCTALPLHFATR